MNVLQHTRAAANAKRARRASHRSGKASCALALALLVGCGGNAGSPENLAKIRKQIDVGEFSTAIVALKSVLQESPDTAEARLLLGRIHLIAGDALNAEAELRRALKAGAAKDEVVPMLAKAMLDAGRGSALIEEFGKYQPATDAAWIDLKSTLAEALARKGQVGDAGALVAEVLKRQPEHSRTQLIQARLMAGAGHPDDALKVVNAVIQHDAASLDALRLKADLTLFSSRNVPEAVSIYTALVKLSPNRVDSRVALITAMLLGENVDGAAQQIAELKKLAPQNIQTRVLEAHIAYVKKDYAQARDISQQLLKLVPDNVDLMELAGSAELHLGAWQKAEVLLGKVVFAAPKRKLARQLLARALLVGGRPEKALEVLRPLLESPQPGAETQIIAAEAQLMLGQTERARALFALAVKLRPDDDRLKTAQVLVDRANSSPEKTIAALGAIASGSDDTSADMALFSLLMQRRDFNGALAAVARLDKKRSKSAMPMYLQAQANAGKDDVAATRASFEAALVREPKFFPAVLGIAYLELRTGHPSDAWKRIEAYLAAEPKHEQGWLALAGMATQFPDGTNRQKQAIERGLAAVPNSVELGVLKIDLLLKERQAKAALAAAQTLRTAHPQRADVLDALGRAQLAVGDTQQAQRTYADMVALAPKSPGALMKQAEVQRLSGDVPAALRSARKAVELAPTETAPMAALMALAVQAKQPEPAKQAIRELRRRAPDDAFSHVLEGDLLMAQKQTDAALAAFRAGTGLPKNGNKAAIRLHAHLLQAKRPAEAQEFAQGWLRKQPKDQLFVAHLGEVAMHAGNFAEAETRFRAVLAMQPADAAALNNTAWALLKQGKPGALAMAREATKLDPANAGFSDTLALALGESGELKQAIEMQSKLVERFPQVHLYRLHLSQLLVTANDRERARPHLDALAKLGNAFAEREEVTRLLSRLAP